MHSRLDQLVRNGPNESLKLTSMSSAGRAVPRARSARKPGSSAEKHDILLLNTLSRPFSYSD